MNTMLRRLTQPGIEAFRAWLADLKQQPRLAPPLSLLNDPATSEPIRPDTPIEGRTFATRFDAASYLVDRLDAASIVNPESDAGLWAWLSLFYIDQLCPKKADASRNVRAIASYIPEIGITRRYYRHLLMGPTMLYLAHRTQPERLRALLCSPVHVSTAETYRLFIEHPALIASPASLEVATRLYFDPRTGKLKRGSGSKDGAGCRQFVRFLQQIDCTFDLGAITALDLFLMLPRVFSRFDNAPTLFASQALEMPPESVTK